MDLPQLIPVQRSEDCIARSSWDPESSTVRCSFRYPTEEAPDFSRSLNQELGVRQGVFRLQLGELDLLVSEEGRAESMELYSNPDHWSPQKLPRVPEAPPTIYLRLDAEFDTNGIATLELPLSVSIDRASSQLALRFGGEAHRWFALADSVFLATDANGRLTEIRLLHFRESL